MEQQPSSLDDLLYRCTVRVEVGGKQKGTGFFVAPGMVLTCAHVVEDVTGQPTAQPIEMYWHWGGRHHTAQIQNTDFLSKPYPDLALLRAGEELEHPCVYLDRYSDVQLDDKLYSYGYTEEYENGDSAYFDYEGPSHDPDFLKLKNAQASHGMSGAPLLDRRTGAVCGILKRSRNPNSDLGGRAVSASTILSSFPELQELQTKYHERNRSWTSLLSYVTRGKFRLSPDDRKGYKADIISPQEHVLMRPHAEPLPPPPPLAGFLDRTSDVDAVTHVLAGGSPADVHGPTGVGKTAMLHQLANHKFDTPFRDGIVFPLAIRRKPLEDLLLDLLDAFYEREPTYIPRSTDLQRHLQNRHALIILDDVELDRDELASLMRAAPDCVFLLASTKQRLWGQGRAVALRGLPSKDALALFERELGRVLSMEERSLAMDLCTDDLKGYPQSLLEAASLMRDEESSLEDIAEQMRRHAGSATEAVTERVLMALTEDQERVLAALASIGDASVGEQHVSALAEVEDFRGVLGALLGRFLVQAHSPRYSLAGSLNEILQEEWDLTSWKTRALEYFTDWTEEHRHAPQRILEEIDALLTILERAAQEGHWERALHLGRAVERALILSGRWGAWSQVLAWQLEAAQGLENLAAKAWALHQSGTRALCLDKAPAARAALTEALQLRESLGDDEGAAVTRHNLGLLGKWWWSKLWRWMIVVVAMLLLILLLLGVLALAGLGPFSDNRDGNGPDSASVVVRPKSLNFGKQEVDTQSEPQPVILANNGSTLLKIADVSASGDFNQEDDCDNVEPEESCSIDVTFSPTSQGDHHGTLIINNASSNSRKVLLNGKGVVQEPGTTTGATTTGTSTTGISTTGTGTTGTSTTGTGTTGTGTTVTCANNGKDDDGDSSIDEPDDCNVVD